MHKLGFIAVTVAAAFAAVVTAFETKEARGVCKAMCSATWGAPASVTVDSGPSCDSAFEYTFKITIGTNDDAACATTGAGAEVGVVPGTSKYCNPHETDIDTFYTYGGGDTTTITVTGDLNPDDPWDEYGENGFSAVDWCTYTTPQQSGGVQVTIIPDSEDCL